MSLLNFCKMIIKTNINAAKQSYRLYKSAVPCTEDLLPEELGSTEFDGWEIKLTKFDLLFAAQGLLDIPAAILAGNQGHAVLFVNTTWQNLDKDSKQAIVAHELGHIRCGHLNKGVLYGILNNFGRLFGSEESTNNELDADMVALEAGHDVGLHNCLIKLLDHARENYLPTKEINARINQIHKYKDSIRKESIISKIKSLFN